ncbi:hypothetical protein BO94DRAFT_540217 [Aspergillus sclerotioniger CBS 115572]|uniref:Uncharacterized protein n=1 Tax=Aspergillus sclerotioniger CBS 115572 TaxID=1450535 RepID=A0A317V904_9EURO|nr:hypothetical protein BO94DRAFT_540217 [Aspergillus sclerotioniger CBS 115572]PWY68540.1 hypothetical protein BO94DRAFT_540217 [Aspergillus sclerotioniger CBS 115572]
MAVNMNVNMNMPPSGKESWPTSPPYIKFHDPFSAASLAYASKNPISHLLSKASFEVPTPPQNLFV